MTGAVRRVVLLVVLTLAGCAEQQPSFDEVAATLPPQSPDVARFFIYRSFEPYQSLSWVPVFLNGVSVGAVGPGQVIMRDEPPGTYRVEAKSQGLWPEQAKTVTVAPGQTVYAKVTSFKGLNPSASRSDVTLTTFVVTLVDAAAGRLEIGKLWYKAEHRRATAG